MINLNRLPHSQTLFRLKGKQSLRGNWVSKPEFGNQFDPNMVDGYTDTPWRERGQWWGDAYVQDYINRAAFGDMALKRCRLLTAITVACLTWGLPPGGKGLILPIIFLRTGG